MPSASDFNNLHADPSSADVATNEFTTSASYGDLTTSGPAVTVSLVAGQKALVEVCAQFTSANDGAIGHMSFAVSGASTLAAADANAAFWVASKTATSIADMSSRKTVYTATSTGSHTFTAKYRSDGTNITHWLDRRIIVKPF